MKDISKNPLRAFGKLRPYVREWIAEPLPSPYRMREPGICYHNAIEDMRDYGDISYVEGYAQNDIGSWTRHGWATNEIYGDLLIDSTWDFGHGRRYLGVPFVSDFVYRAKEQSAFATGQTLVLAKLLSEEQLEDAVDVDLIHRMDEVRAGRLLVPREYKAARSLGRPNAVKVSR
jgi:hypothetical protein